MVFATDFDPTATPARRKASQANISPVHQTNRLIAQATQSQAVAKAAAMERAQQQQAVDAEAAMNMLGNERDRSHPASSAVVVPLPTGVAALPLKARPSLPLWLQVLNRVQHGSTAVASVLIAGALVLYGSTVYVDKSTDRALARLNQLQSESQQLTAANEAIKQSLAEQAMQKDSGLEPHEAGDVLFVAPQPLRPAKAPAESSTERIRPLGY